MKNDKRKSMGIKNIAAAALRRDGFEVYTMPDSPIKVQPSLVAFKENTFFNIYLYKTEEEKDEVFKSELLEEIKDYASVMNARIITAVVNTPKIIKLDKKTEISSTDIETKY